MLGLECKRYVLEWAQEGQCTQELPYSLCLNDEAPCNEGES